MEMPFYLSYTALWALVILHSLILLGVVRIVYQLQQTGTPTDRRSLRTGDEAPAFSATDLSGTSIRSTNLAGRPKVLLFVSPNCPGCVEMLEHDTEYLNHKAQGNMIIICQAGREDCIQLAKQYRLNMPIIADEDDQISRLYGISSVPMAVLINANNRIQSYGQPQREELGEVVEQALEAQAQGV